MDSPIEHVSDTALWVTAARAYETSRPDRLIDDPLAELLAGPRGMAILDQMPFKEGAALGLGLRTRIIDEFILRVIDRDGVDVVLSLGAGLDTRAWRLPLPANFSWIEADLPGIVAYKGERIGDRAPKCRLERLAVDLTDDTARRDILKHAASKVGRILLLTEGLLGYLPSATVEGLVEEVSSLPAFAFWIFDTYARFPAQVREVLGRVGSATPMSSKERIAFVQAHGWQVAERRRFSDEAEKLAAERVKMFQSRMEQEHISPADRQRGGIWLFVKNPGVA